MIASAPATQDSDAAPSSTLAALMGGASQVADQAGSTARATTPGLNSAGPLNLASLESVTADTTSVVGAAGSSSDSDFQDADQQGAAKIVRDQANAAKAAETDSDMPDAVLEATFGGLLAPATLASTASDEPAGADTTVTADTISDLASQTVAHASTSAGGVKSFQIVLNPEGLGQVTVAVSIAADGKLNAAFTFEKPEAAAALSAHAGDLHAALAQSGFDASTSGLSFAAAPQTIAAAPIASQPLTLNLGQDFAQGAATGGSVQGATGSIRDWALAASESAARTSFAYDSLAAARGLDLRA